MFFIFRIKFVGFNALTFAVHQLCDPKLIDYLLAKSISPAERDLITGFVIFSLIQFYSLLIQWVCCRWNIYHMICHLNDGDLLEHFLRKLPRDVSEALLTQQSKGRLNTVCYPLYFIYLALSDVYTNL